MNINEATVGRLTNENYSWLIKGSPGSIKNISFLGSLNIISIISSTGASYSAIKTGSTNAAIFICYLKKLLNSVKTLEGIPSTRILLILDNAPSHQAKEVLRYLEENRKLPTAIFTGTSSRGEVLCLDEAKDNRSPL